MTGDRIDDYRLAAHAQDLRAETATSGWAGDLAAYYGRTEAHGGFGVNGAEKRLTLKRWLQQTQMPAVDDLEEARVRRMLWANAQDAHAALDQAREAYQAAADERAAVLAELIAAGETYQQVATIVGLTKTAVHQLVKAHTTKTAVAR